ncbi:MAG: hypothetical protein JNJ54_00790 [Myxococcaceae bacterium]|nr:hypothetical protein [Myxococcaceae bacterium]
MRLAAVSLMVLLAGCTCRRGDVPKPVTPRPPHLVTAWAPHEVSATPEDVYGVPAWSKVFALAFERRANVGVPVCALDGGCLDSDALALRGEPMVSRDLVLGRDEPLAFIGEQVTFLEAPARRVALEQALDEAMRVDPASAPVAAVLFQNDLWERVDAISEAIRREPDADWAALTSLRAKLVRLMHHVALPRVTVEALRPNEALVERQFPELLAGFTARDGWFEVLVAATERRGALEWKRTTRHSERHGFRVVFRVFVHEPRGRAAVEQKLSRWPEPFPEGTRFVITGTPVVISKERELLTAPFITLLETRQARGEGAPPGVVGGLPVDVLEGRRATLSRHLETTGGLERLPRDALIPVGATCMPDFTSRVPLASTCLTCHGPTGARINGPMMHGEVKVSLADEPGAAATAVAQAKRRSDDFRVLDW